jgi:hypothetical protein
MITRLCAFDFDATLMNTPEKETGQRFWSYKMGMPFKYQGWWGRPESLDMNVFDIKPFPKVLSILNKDVSTPDTYTIVLTSRQDKLRPLVQAVLDANHINVDKLDMQRGARTKGQKILDYASKLSDLKEINVYDDRDTDIASYEGIRSLLPEGIKFNIYIAKQGELTLDEVTNIVAEEIQNFVAEDGYVYHGTYDGAGYYIQRTGSMKINAANNNEPYISFTGKPNVAKYYADMKGGSARGIVLRTRKTDDFQLSPKYKKNDSYEWVTTREIPVDELEINTKYGWIPLNAWDFINKEIKQNINEEIQNSIQNIDINNIKINGELILVDTNNPNEIISVHNNGKIPLDKLRVETMIKKLKTGSELPPVVLDKNNLLKDGYHRYYAYKMAGRKTIPFQKI